MNSEYRVDGGVASSGATENGIGKPESARQYETGIRFSFLNERVVPSTAAFNVSRDNVATVVSGLLPNGQELVVFDSQLTNGVEASLQAKITDQWQILANATHQEAVITGAPQAATIGIIRRRTGEHGQRLEHLQIRDQRHLGIPGRPRRQLSRQDL